MSSPYAITTVEELRAGVGALLQRVYVDEWGKQVEAAAPPRARRRSSRTLLAIDRSGVVGTARLTLGPAVPAEEQRRLQLEHFSAALPLEQTAVGGRLAVAAHLRSSGLSLDLVRASITLALGSGVRLLFTSSQPHLLNLYGQLGFTSYGPVASKDGVGVLVPVVLDLTDRDRLVRLGSPLRDLLPATSEPTLRDVITSTPGHEARCRRADEVREALAGEAGPLDHIDPRVLPALLRSAHLLPVGPGHLVVSRGQSVRTLFYVLEGRLDVVNGGAPERARAGLAGQTEHRPTDGMSSREAGERSRRTHHTDDGGEVVDTVETGGFAGEVSYLLGVRQRHDLRAGPHGARLLALPVQAFADRADGEVAAEAFLMVLIDALRARRSFSRGGVQ